MLQKRTILLVGIQESFSRDLAASLDSQHIHVKTADNVHTGFSLFCAETVDLVVSDAHIEKDSGFELMARIKAFAPDKPVILLVGGDKKVNSQDVYDMGANAVLQKPLSVDHLIRAIGILIGKDDPHLSARPPRHPAQLDVELEYLSTGTNITTRTTNIGRGGFFAEVDSDQIPPKNSLLSFEILIKENPRLIEIKGEVIVRWTRVEKGELPTGIGVEFIVLEDDHRAKIIALTEMLKGTFK